MWNIYILQSLKDRRYYVGCTNQPIDERVEGHNSGDTPSTKYRRPLVVVYRERVQNQEEAFAREKVIKSYKGGNAFKKLVEKN